MAVRDWASSRCFNFVHGRNLVYNTCWEDPRLDREALQLTPDDRVLVITSAGCNVLDYALLGPRCIHAVDVNPRQNALLELKIAGIKRLDYDTFFALFGRGRLRDFEAVYRDSLRAELSPAAARFWDRHLDFFTGAGRRWSFYFRGTTGAFAWLMNQYIDRVAKIREQVDAILHADNLDEQRAIYDRGLRSAFWSRSLRWFVRRDATLSLLGVPRPQRQQVERFYDGGIARFVEDAVEAVFTRLPLVDNYFWRVYLTGKYSRQCCPEYLKPENFSQLQGGLVDCIRIHTTTVTDFLTHHDEPISRFVLLDHMDWLATCAAPLLIQEWQAIVDRADRETRILWRSGGMDTRFVDEVPVRVGSNTVRVGDVLSYHRQLADQLHSRDRVHTYGSFHVADLTVA